MAKRSHRTSVRMRSPWQPYFSARALLVSLRLPQVHDSAIFGESQIGDKDFGEFRTAKRAGQHARTFRICAVRSGSFPFWAVPMVRRIPFNVSPTMALRVLAGETL